MTQINNGEADVRPDLENCLRAIWVDCLEIPEIKSDDDFFEVGGHSLIAIEIIQKVRSLLGVERFPVDLFETPTIASMADNILARLVRGEAA